MKTPTLDTQLWKTPNQNSRNYQICANDLTPMSLMKQTQEFHYLHLHTCHLIIQCLPEN